MNIDEHVLIAGGYGIVGAQVAQILRSRHREISVAIAGRNPDKAGGLVAELGNAVAVSLDMGVPECLERLPGTPRAVVGVVNDPQDYLLLAAVRAGVPYLDITRWTDRMRSSVLRATAAQPTAPAIFGSEWMVGIATTAAAMLARDLESVDRVDIDILYSLKDKSGPDSIEYMDRLHLPFPVSINGELVEVSPFSDAKTVSFPGGFTGKTYRFDTPDQVLLPTALNVSNVSARIGFDDKTATASLAGLVRSGVFRMISGPRFTRLRRGLLHGAGDGGSHEIVVTLEGSDSNGRRKTTTATIVDQEGQTHLTAVGTVLQLERLLGLDGAAPLPAGVHFPESDPQFDHFTKTLDDEGAILSVSN